MADNDIKIQISTAANTQGAEQATKAIEGVKAATAGNITENEKLKDSSGKVEDAQGKMAAATEKTTVSKEGLSRAVNRLAQAYPQLGGAFQSMLTLMNPLTAAITVAGSAVLGFFEILKRSVYVPDLSGFNRMSSIFGDVEKQTRAATEEAERLAKVLKDMEASANTIGTRLQRTLAEINRSRDLANQISAEKEKQEGLAVDADLASGKIGPEEAARRKGGIRSRRESEREANNIEQARQTAEAVESAIVASRTQQTLAAEKLRDAQARMTGVATPEGIAARLKEVDRQLVELDQSIAAITRRTRTSDFFLSPLEGMDKARDAQEMGSLRKRLAAERLSLRMYGPQMTAPYRSAQEDAATATRDLEEGKRREIDLMGGNELFGAQTGMIYTPGVNAERSRTRQMEADNSIAAARAKEVAAGVKEQAEADAAYHQAVMRGLKEGAEQRRKQAAEIDRLNAGN